MSDYSYQDELANRALDSALNCGMSIIAASCGSGKSSMIKLLINRFVKLNGPESKVLVVCENMTSLRDQFLAEMEQNITINFTYGEISEKENVTVRVGIAASLQKLTWDKVDLIIFDEIHRQYRECRIQKFLRKIKPKYQVGCTGTASSFVRDNKTQSKKIPIHFLSGAELMKKGIYASVDLFITRTPCKQNPQQMIKDVLTNAKKENVNLKKVLIVCGRVAHAEAMASYLRTMGYKVYLSTSKNDRKNEILMAHKAADSGYLITVGKVSMGYNDGSLTALIHCDSPTGNLNANVQVFSRILRRFPGGSDERKAYIRVSTQDSKNYNAQYYMLLKLKAMLDDKTVFSKFDGRNLKIQFF